MEHLYMFYELANGQITSLFVALVVVSMLLEKFAIYATGGTKDWRKAISEIKGHVGILLLVLISRAVFSFLGFEAEANWVVLILALDYLASIADSLSKLGAPTSGVMKLLEKLKGKKENLR